MERTPEDPNFEPTQMAGYDYGAGGNYRDPVAYSSDPYAEPVEQPSGRSQPPEPPPTPWYLRPVALIGWGVLTAILLAALVWGMVRVASKDGGHTVPTTTTTVSSTAGAPAEEPSAPSPQPVVPDSPTSQNPPPATTTEPPASTTQPPTSTVPSTTVAPSTTVPTTTMAPTTTVAPTTTAPPATTSGAARPPQIVIPLPPGL